MKIDYQEIDRIMNELAREKGYVNYEAQKNDYARNIGFIDWEHYQKFLIRKREERREEKERIIRKRRNKKRKKKKEKEPKIKRKELEQAISCGLF